MDLALNNLQGLICHWTKKQRKFTYKRFTYKSHTHTHTHTYIYIYIYIYCHPQTDCFVVSQFFSVARHVGRYKLGSKPTRIYIRQAYHVGQGIIRYYVATTAAAFVCLHFIPYWIPEGSIRSKRFALCEIPSPKCSTRIGERIYCHPQTNCFVVSQLFSVASFKCVQMNDWS